MQELKKAELWDSGSESDDLRNKVVIPIVSSLIAHERPESILDVGAGTGYLSRRVDDLLPFRPAWTLLDIDRERLSVAQKRSSPTTNLKIVAGDITDVRLMLGQFSVVLISFTLLETGITSSMVDRIRQICMREALVIVVMPDVLSDVIAANEQRPGIARAFLAGETQLRKVDKFTNAEYPFHAVRVEEILKHFLADGFALEGFQQGQIDQRSVFVFSFRHRHGKDEYTSG